MALVSEALVTEHNSVSCWTGRDADTRQSLCYLSARSTADHGRDLAGGCVCVWEML